MKTDIFQTVRRKTSFLATTVIVAGIAASTANANILDNLSGTWKGKGSAYLKGMGNLSATCKFKIDGDIQAASMQGKCGKLMFRVPLDLQLQHDGGNRYSGIYSGSRTGPAKLSGVLSGDTLTMDIVWNGEVNGDRKATMVLVRTGPDVFMQIVSDIIDGELKTTSSFTFTRS